MSKLKVIYYPWEVNYERARIIVGCSVDIFVYFATA
jgi:hypothetical protein